MRIVNPKVREAVEAGQGLRLNLGSGLKPRPGFFSVDSLPLPGVDIVADLNEPLDQLPDHAVAEIYSRHAFEHVTALLPLMAELHRVTRSDGRIEIIVPHFSNPYGYSDPTHVRFFGLYSFFYFADRDDQPRRKVPSFYLPERFLVESIHFRLMRQSFLSNWWLSLMRRYINGHVDRLDWYERRMCWWYPVESIRYVLKPKKANICYQITVPSRTTAALGMTTMPSRMT